MMICAHVSEEHPISQCDCPNCNHHWQITPGVGTNSNRSIALQLLWNYLSPSRYPSNDTLNVFDPQGLIRPHLSIAIPPQTHSIRQLIYYHKEQQAYQWIKNLGWLMR
jgi:hypothetical protein